MRQYLDLMEKVLKTGVEKRDRTGTGTLSIFGHQMRFDLAEAFRSSPPRNFSPRPSSTSCSGSCAAKPMCAGCRSMAFPSGTNGRMRMASSGPSMAISGAPGRADRRHHRPDHQSDRDIKRNPDSRRLIVTAWNPADVPKMALPPCHCLFQFYVANGKISCQLYQRSADIFLGVPFNIASYALLTMMVAQVTGYEPGEFIHTLRRRPSLSQSSRSGARTAFAQALSVADDAPQSGR